MLLGHPDSDSFNGQIADSFYQSAVKAGHEVRMQCLGKMKFDPVLWKGYKVVQELEPDLKTAQENILWCEKWVIIYPIWWGSIPALLKGFLDRTLYSGFAYKYRQNGWQWDKLLKGRSALIITTCDAPVWWIWWQYRNSDLNTLKRATLQFCGITPVAVKRYGKLRKRNESQREQILKEVKLIAENL